MCYLACKRDRPETMEQPVIYGHDGANQQNIGTPASQQIPMQSFQSYPQQSHSSQNFPHQNYQFNTQPPQMTPPPMTQPQFAPPSMQSYNQPPPPPAYQPPPY